MPKRNVKKTTYDLMDTIRELQTRLADEGISLPSRMRLTPSITIDNHGYVHVWKKSGKGRLFQKEYTIETFFANNRLSRSELKNANTSLADFHLVIKFLDRKLRAGDIVKCKNQDIRRYLLNGYGFDKFMREMKGEKIHRDGDSELVKFEWDDDAEPLVMVKVKDTSTGEVYLLRVPPTMRRCKEAVAWTFSLQETEYIPIKEA